MRRGAEEGRTPPRVTLSGLPDQIDALLPKPDIAAPAGKPTLTQQAEAILARAKAIDAYTDADLRDPDIWEARSNDVLLLMKLCDTILIGADELSNMSYEDRAYRDSDHAYEAMIGDQLVRGEP